jgi:hypothetical protein
LESKNPAGRLISPLEIVRGRGGSTTIVSPIRASSAVTFKSPASRTLTAQRRPASI